MQISEEIYSYQAFRTYTQDYPDKLLELVHGRIVEKVTGQQHAIIALTIGTHLRIWQKTNGIVGYSGVEMSHRNTDDDTNVRIPDVSFSSATDQPTEEAAPSLPDFAVEIKSPGNTIKGLREKAQFYVDNGVQLVWIVYPSKKVVDVYQADGTIEIFTEGDTLFGGDVLPKFEMTVTEIFEM